MRFPVCLGDANADADEVGGSKCEVVFSAEELAGGVYDCGRRGSK